MEELNVYNCLRKNKNDDPIKYIFTKTNENIIEIIKKNKPASITRIGGSDYGAFVKNTINTNIYELNGYFDKTTSSLEEEMNFKNIRQLYLDSLNNCDMITVCTYDTIKSFGFIPNESQSFEEKEKTFLLENINKNIPICHWDFVNLDYEHNFFLNVFPELNDKKICIISSFTDDIKEQLQYKDNLFINKCCNNRVGVVYKNFNYPTFKDVEYVKVPLCQIKYENRLNLNTDFKNSLELIENLKNQLLNTDADIYLIGAGLYSNILCNFIKITLGKISINCGLAIQLFFGLLGNRFMYLEDQKVTNEYWKYPDMLKCNKFTANKSEMGGVATDGIQAYTCLDTTFKKNIFVMSCFKTGTTLIQNIYNINKSHHNIIYFKENYLDEYNDIKIIIFPFRDVNKIYKSAFFQDIIVPSYNYSPFHKGNFLDIYKDESDEKKMSIIKEIDVKLLINFFNTLKWDKYVHLNCINRINELNNMFNINIDYYSTEPQEFTIDNKKLIAFNIDIFEKYFNQISYSIFGVNNYKYPKYISNDSKNKWYIDKYTEFLKNI